MAHIRHVGLVVNDMERAIQFYTRVFDLTVTSEAFEQGSYLDTLLTLDGAKIQWCKLSNPINNVFIELIKYYTHVSGAYSPPVYQHGCSHLALTVADIDETLCKLRAFGGIALDPLYNPENTVRVVYARDPEGIILELVQDL